MATVQMSAVRVWARPAVSIGEAINLKFKDIRPQSGVLYVRQANGNQDRPVPLSASVNSLLDE